MVVWRCFCAEICLFMFLWLYFIFKVFINIQIYANKEIYISDHMKKNMCLSCHLILILVL